MERGREGRGASVPVDVVRRDRDVRLGASSADIPLFALVSLVSLVSLVARISLVALRARVSLRPLCTRLALRTLRARGPANRRAIAREHGAGRYARHGVSVVATYHEVTHAGSARRARECRACEGVVRRGRVGSGRPDARACKLGGREPAYLHVRAAYLQGVLGRVVEDEGLATAHRPVAVGGEGRGLAVGGDRVARGVVNRHARVGEQRLVAAAVLEHVQALVGEREVARHEVGERRVDAQLVVGRYVRDVGLRDRVVQVVVAENVVDLGGVDGRVRGLDVGAVRGHPVEHAHDVLDRGELHEGAVRVRGGLTRGGLGALGLVDGRVRRRLCQPRLTVRLRRVPHRLLGG